MGNKICAAAKHRRRVYVVSATRRKADCNTTSTNGGIPQRGLCSVVQKSESCGTPRTDRTDISDYTDGPVREEVVVIRRENIRTFYKVTKRELGRGTYGVVRRCIHRKSGEEFACKSIEKMGSSKRVERVRKEIDIIAALDHPNILNLMEVYEDDAFIHLIMPLCTGKELYDHILTRFNTTKERAHSEQEAKNLMCKLIDAITYCHGKDVVHRDLKPENILFEHEGAGAQPKIIDFGLAKVFNDPLNDSSNSTKHQFMSTRVGTPYYVAPEVIQGKYDSKCDIWSLGVILYILLCGYPPFCGTHDRETFERIQYHPLVFPAPDWAHISAEAKALLARMLSKDPARRPPAARLLEHPWFRQTSATAGAAAGRSKKGGRMGVTLPPQPSQLLPEEEEDFPGGGAAPPPVADGSHNERVSAADAIMACSLERHAIIGYFSSSSSS